LSAQNHEDYRMSAQYNIREMRFDFMMKSGKMETLRDPGPGRPSRTTGPNDNAELIHEEKT